MDSSTNPAEPSDDLPEIAKGDPMAPPDEACLCYCLHCQRQVMSDQMWFQTETKNGKVVGGFWMCPTPNCDGAGFQFDLYPVDPDHPANQGWSCNDDDDDEDFEDDDFGEEGISSSAGTDTYDPGEPEYAAIEDDDGDLEGEEWKHGLQPGERPPESESTAEARRQFEEEQKRYDMPDERPRSFERTGDDDRPGQDIDYGDIPF